MAAQLNFGTGDSVGFGTTGSGGSGTASFAKSALANVAVGDLLVAYIHNQSSAAGATMTAPSGWIRYGAPLGNVTTNATRISGVYYYPVRTTADITAIPTTVTWTFSDSVSRVACVVARATGIDLDSIEDSAASSFPAGTAGTTMSVPSITTVNPTTLLVGAVYHQNSASTTSPTITSFMTAFQEYKTAPTGSALGNTGSALGYTYLTTAGPTGTVPMTMDSSAAASSGELVAFKAGPWSNAAPIVRPTIVGTPTTYVSNIDVTSFTINVPSGVRDGDLLVLALSGQTNTATGDFSSSGWQRISQPFEASSANDRVIAFYAHPVPTATALTQASYTFTSADSLTGGRIAAEMFIVRGANLSQMTTAISPYGSSLNNAVVSVQPGTASIANNLLLAAYGGQFTNGLDAGIASGPGSMTQHSSIISSTNTATTRTTLAIYRQDVDAGTPSLKTLTWNSSAAQTAGVSVSIRGAAAASTNYGKALKYTSATNTLSDGLLFYTSATGVLSTPLEIRPVPKGYATVAAMLAASPFYVAHRGGSVNWPEMSLHAYTQSAFWGVGALELSLARTSDGVWFGLHDSSLDRTTLNTGGGSGTSLVASTLTWAQVQTYAINYPTTISNPSSLPKPYVRWEDIMKAYYGTHVIFVDPKVASGYTTELLNMMDAMPNSPTTHFVGKYYGVSGNAGNTSGWAKDLADRGYSRWGYFYQADVPSLSAYQGRWDILGMDYNADSSSWTAVKSYGKPVIGHIVPSSAAASTALGYGANGLMVSGVQQIIPRSA